MLRTFLRRGGPTAFSAVGASGAGAARILLSGTQPGLHPRLDAAWPGRIHSTFGRGVHPRRTQPGLEGESCLISSQGAGPPR